MRGRRLVGHTGVKRDTSRVGEIYPKIKNRIRGPSSLFDFIFQIREGARLVVFNVGPHFPDVPTPPT